MEKPCGVLTSGRKPLRSNDVVGRSSGSHRTVSHSSSLGARGSTSPTSPQHGPQALNLFIYLSYHVVGTLTMCLLIKAHAAENAHATMVFDESMDLPARL